MTPTAPQREHATDVVRRLADAGHTALWAGGCVRDMLRGRAPKDYDVATDATPDRVRELFGRRRTIPVGESFGVIIVLGETKAHGQVEVATFRAEGPYLDGRRPESVTYCTPEEDARRRDFTINGMFYDPLTDRVLDYVGGREDLQAGLVRCIGNAGDRFDEDKLRMLRAVRFAATLDFRLDNATADAIHRRHEEILVVSWERIAQELKRMLTDVHRRRALRLCHSVGLLDVLLPELSHLFDDDEATDVGEATLAGLQSLEAPPFELAAAVLLHSIPSPQDVVKRHVEQGTVRSICQRLRLSNDETDTISRFVAHRDDFDDASNLTLAQLKRRLAVPRVGEMFRLARVLQNDESSLAGIAFAEEYHSATPAEVIDPPPLVTGADLIGRGLKPGPRFKTLLEEIRDAQLNEEVASREEAFKKLETL